MGKNKTVVRYEFPNEKPRSFNPAQDGVTIYAPSVACDLSGLGYVMGRLELHKDFRSVVRRHAGHVEAAKAELCEAGLRLEKVVEELTDIFASLGCNEEALASDLNTFRDRSNLKPVQTQSQIPTGPDDPEIVREGPKAPQAPVPPPWTMAAQ